MTFDEFSDLVARELWLEGQDVQLEATLGSMGLDSLQMIQLVLVLEELLDAELDLDALTESTTAADVFAMVSHISVD